MVSTRTNTSARARTQRAGDGAGGRSKTARAREVVGLPNPTMESKYTDAIREMVEADPGVRPKMALKRMRNKFCTSTSTSAEEPGDWPGDHKILEKIAFTKAGVRATSGTVARK